MHPYTCTVTSLVLLHCQFFGLWAPGLGSVNIVELYLVLQLYSCSKFALPFSTVQLLVLVLPLFL